MMYKEIEYYPSDGRNSTEMNILYPGNEKKLKSNIDDYFSRLTGRHCCSS